MLMGSARGCIVAKHDGIVLRGQSLVHRVAHGEAVTTLGAATGQHLAAIGSFHAMTEAVLVGFLAI